jgi:hypothetical protein
MKLEIKNGKVVMTGKVPFGVGGKIQADITMVFDEIQEAIDFCQGNDLSLADDPIAFGYMLPGLAIQITEGKMAEAKIHEAIVFSTDCVWADALRKLATILEYAADELESDAVIPSRDLPADDRTGK